MFVKSYILAACGSLLVIDSLGFHMIILLVEWKK